MPFNARAIEAQRNAQIKVNRGVSLGEPVERNHVSLKLPDLFPWISIFQAGDSKRAETVIHDEVTVKPQAE